jgi:pilus assembly protein CpaC
MLWALGGILLCASMPVQGQSLASNNQGQQPSGSAARDLFVTVGKSLVIESPVNVQRISVGDSAKAEVTAVSPRELLINGKAEGATSLIVWQQGGNRLVFDLRVQSDKLETVRHEIKRELSGQDVTVSFADGAVYLHGTVKDMNSAERALSIAGSLGKVVNLLRVSVPAIEDQVLLQVKFMEVDREISQSLSVNMFSLGALNTLGQTAVGQSTAPTVTMPGAGAAATASISNPLNIFLFRPDLNLGATIQALASRNQGQILAEPNLLALSGKEASFLAGGEIPIPIITNSLGGASVSVLYKEFGVKLKFTPVVTARNTIRLKVAPEYSEIDKSNEVTYSGLQIPAFSTRKIETEIELQNMQSFGIAGLLSTTTENDFSKIPGIGDIPIIGKLFQSRNKTKNKQELLVVVTPEIVRPMPAGLPMPNLDMPDPFLKPGANVPPRTPGVDKTGTVPMTSAVDSVPFEQLVEKPNAPPTTQGVQLLTIPMTSPAPAPANP